MSNDLKDQSTEKVESDLNKGWLRGLLSDHGKFRLAEEFRLQGDNERVLNTTRKADKDFRSYQDRVREALAKKQFGEDYEAKQPIPESVEEPMKISIDSPTTINETHNHYPPPEKKPMGALGKAAITAALIGGGATLVGRGF